MISYAQNAEDVVLARALPGPEGFYVDVGAADPEVASVTKHFYDRGWRGINIDPRPGAVARLRAARPRDVNLQVAAGSRHGTVELFVVNEDADLSTTDGSDRELLAGRGYTGRCVETPVRTLDDILEEHADGPIDFVKIDVEGGEADVLAGLDLLRWQPAVVVVEAVQPYSHVRTDGAWRGILEAAGYEEACFDGLNLFFALKGDTAVLQALVPASPVDDFQPFRVHNLETEFARLGTYTHDLEQQIADLQQHQADVATYVRRLEEALEGGGAGADGSLAPPTRRRRRRRPARTARLAVIATPRTGNTWVRRVLADALGATEMPVHHPADIDWNRLPDRFVIQLPWPRTALLQRRLAAEGVTVVSPGRHPLDVLLSMAEFARREPNVDEWLGGSVVERERMQLAREEGSNFVAWATSEAAKRLLAVTPAWWTLPSTLRVRYEDLVDEPEGRFAELLADAQVAPVQDLRAAVAANSASAIHALSGNVHVWRGRPGAWTELLGPDEAVAAAQANEDVFAALGYELPSGEPASGSASTH